MGIGHEAEGFAELAAALHAAPSPTETAEEVVGFAREQLDADHAGITLMRANDRLETVAPTDDVVVQADALQYELAEGPCRDASWTGDTLLSSDVASDPRWPDWGPKAAALGIVSALAVELTSSAGARIGAVNLFWGRPRAFDRDDIAFAHVFTRHAALALASSFELANLNVALDARKRIGQAQGMLMERFGLDEDRAFEVLRRYSQNHNLKLRQVAERLVATRVLPADHDRAVPPGRSHPAPDARAQRLRDPHGQP